ncbi:MAG: TetR/AcrR family transcriptional regulator [Bacilli bacterium]|nr:TetR/AcrR family transcriptional regulator [Bacilli bacterium]
MPRGETNCNQLKDERRSLIIKSALKLFSLKGYDSVKINDIAKEASCTHSLLYHYYDSKEAIFKDVMENGYHSLRENTLLFDDYEEDAKKALEYFVNKVYILLNTDNDSCYHFYLVTNLHYQHTLPISKEKFHEMVENGVWMHIYNIVKKGIEQGTFYEGIPEVLTNVFYCTLRGLLFDRINTPFNEYHSPDEKTLLHILLKN